MHAGVDRAQIFAVVGYRQHSSFGLFRTNPTPVYPRLKASDVVLFGSTLSTSANGSQR